MTLGMRLRMQALAAATNSLGVMTFSLDLNSKRLASPAR